MSVEALLIEKGISFTSSGKDYLIKCLNPDHDDSNPSLRVDKINGVALVVGSVTYLSILGLLLIMLASGWLNSKKR
jgi:hypothetical protein